MLSSISSGTEFPLSIQPVGRWTNLAKRQPLRLSTSRKWRRDTAWIWWVGNGAETSRLQIDPPLSEPDSESKRQRKRHQRKGQACTRPGQDDHRYATKWVMMTGIRGSRILNTADQIWPYLRWNNLSVFLRPAFYKRSLQWNNLPSAKQQGSDSKQWSFQYCTPLH